MIAVPDVLVITRADIVRVMDQRAWLAAADTAFRAAGSGEANAPQPLHLPMPGGGFHAKGASLRLERDWAAVKVNGNFPGNPAGSGLPTIQGAVILADGGNGVLLAILDSTEITLRRTAAASALAASLLAKPDARNLLVCGCGEQGGAHVAALRDVLPLTHVMTWDRDPDAAARLARMVGGTAVQDLGSASLTADVIACCTSARVPYLDAGMVKPGTFIAAVGADHPDKSEIAPALMAASLVVTDSVEQCLVMGDLHHAAAAGLKTKADVLAVLSEFVDGTRRGRPRVGETVVFDSTGTGLQDVTASALIYERCLAAGVGQRIPLGALP